MNLLEALYDALKNSTSNLCRDEQEVQDGEVILGDIPPDMINLYYLLSNTGLELARISKEFEEHNKLHEEGKEHPEDDCKRFINKLLAFRCRRDAIEELFWNSLRLSNEKFLSDKIGVRKHGDGYKVVRCKEEGPPPIIPIGIALMRM